MQKVSKWAMYAGLSAIALTGLAGCNNGGGDTGNSGVSPSIESPVMNKADDKALAGSDAGSGNSTSTDGSASNSTASTGNSTMSNSTSTSNSAMSTGNTASTGSATGNSAMSNGATTAKKNGAGGTGSKMSGAGGKSTAPAPNTKKQ